MFLCISMLARAVGSNIEAAIRPILEQMFSVGLSRELTSALKVLAHEIPSLQKEIQGNVLNMNDVHVHTRVHSSVYVYVGWGEGRVSSSRKASRVIYRPAPLVMM